MNVVIRTNWNTRGLGYFSVPLFHALRSVNPKLSAFTACGENGYRMPMLGVPNTSDVLISIEKLGGWSEGKNQRWWIPMWELISPKWVDVFKEPKNVQKIICPTRACFGLIHKYRSVGVEHCPWTIPDFPTKIDYKSGGRKVLCVDGGGGMGLRKGSDVLLNAARILEGAGVKIDVVSFLKRPPTTPSNVNWVSSRLDRRDVIKLYLEYDFLIAPSRREGFGMAIFEALSYGLPVITTNGPPMNEHVDTSRGWLVDVKSKSVYNLIESCEPDPEDLARKIQVAVSANNEEIRNKSIAARKFAEESNKGFYAFWNAKIFTRFD